MRSRDRGFTLIELLVVVAIIAILVSLLLPALSKGKQQAQLAACKSNVRQWAYGIQMFTADYGHFPYFIGQEDDSPEKRNWSSSIPELYLSGYNMGSIWRCPRFRPSAYPLLQGQVGPNFGIQYGMNEAVGGLWPADSTQPRKESEVVAPSALYFLGDAAGYRNIYDQVYINRYFTFFPIDSDYHRVLPRVAKIRPAHAKTLNVSAFDGHVESRPIEPLFFPTNQVDRARWFIDHQPHNELFW